MSFLNQFENLGIEKSLIQHCKIVLILSQLGHLTLNCIDNFQKKSHLLKKLAFTKVYNLDRNNQVTLLLQYKLVMVLSQLGQLTLDWVENHPKKSFLLKKLAFTKVYNLDINNQVTLIFTLFKCQGTSCSNKAAARPLNELL